jgi:hypothetical protein
MRQSFTGAGLARPMVVPVQGELVPCCCEAKAAEAAHNSSAPLDEWDDVNGDDDQAHRGALVASRRRSTTGTRVIELLPGRISNPLDRLGIGEVDPFEVYPSELPKQVVSPTLDQSW